MPIDEYLKQFGKMKREMPKRNNGILTKLQRNRTYTEWLILPIILRQVKIFNLLLHNPSSLFMFRFSFDLYIRYFLLIRHHPHTGDK